MLDSFLIQNRYLDDRNWTVTVKFYSLFVEFMWQMSFMKLDFFAAENVCCFRSILPILSNKIKHIEPRWTLLCLQMFRSTILSISRFDFAIFNLFYSTKIYFLIVKCIDCICLAESVVLEVAWRSQNQYHWSPIINYSVCAINYNWYDVSLEWYLSIKLLPNHISFNHTFRVSFKPMLSSKYSMHHEINISIAVAKMVIQTCIMCYMNTELNIQWTRKVHSKTNRPFIINSNQFVNQMCHMLYLMTILKYWKEFKLKCTVFCPFFLLV